MLHFLRMDFNMKIFCLICAKIGIGEKSFSDIMFLGLFVIMIIGGIIQLINFLRFKHAFIPRGMSFFDVFDSKRPSGAKYLWDGIFLISFPTIFLFIFIPIIIFYILKFLRAILR